MTTKQFIEKAIEGGWRKEEKPDIFNNNNGIGVQFLRDGNTDIFFESDFFLDPKAWEAVGKIEGWSEEVMCRSESNDMEIYCDESEFMMHKMVAFLCLGKTIEQFLSEL